MASIDEAIERGVKNAFERPQEILGGRSLNQLLAEFHTGEIEPVVHGRWIDYKDDHQCSVCKEHTIIDAYAWKAIQFEFCPWCGAKMDGERRESE